MAFELGVVWVWARRRQAGIGFCLTTLLGGVDDRGDNQCGGKKVTSQRLPRGCWALVETLRWKRARPIATS
jgi:hypothetical protein